MLQNGNIFGVAKISIFLFFFFERGGGLEILDIFGVKGRCWARAYICRKIESTPLGGYAQTTLMDTYTIGTDPGFLKSGFKGMKWIPICLVNLIF